MLCYTPPPNVRAVCVLCPQFGLSIPSPGPVMPQPSASRYTDISSVIQYRYLRISIIQCRYPQIYRYIWCYEGWQLFNLHISTVYLVLSRVDTLTHLYTILLSRVVRSHRITITNLRVTIQLYLCVNNIDIPGYLCIPCQNV